MTTLLGVLHERAQTEPDQLATIVKRRGRWIPTSVGELDEQVAATAVGLAGLGLGPGQRVGLLLGNIPDWLVVDLAVQAVGAISVAVPLHADDQVTAELLRDADVSLVIVDDPVDAAGISGRVIDPTAQSSARFLCLGDDADGFTGLDGVVRDGSAELDRRPDAFAQMIAGLDPEGAATATYTAGAGGAERAIVHSARAQIAQASRVAAALDLDPHDVTVVALDPSHPFERAVTLYPAIVSGAVLAYPENSSTIAQSILEVRPTFLHLPVERARAASASVHARFRRNRGLKRLVARWWNRSAANAVESGGTPSRLAVRVVGRPALRSLGWDNLRSLLITGSRVPLDVLVTLQALGAPVLGGYATVESGLVAAGTPRTTAGLAVLDGVSVSLRDDELVVTGDGIGAGELTASPSGVEYSDAVSTGDAVGLGDGTVLVRGPRRSTMATPDGGVVLTAEVEASLRDSPYIALASVRVADGLLRADIEIDFDSASDWAAERNLHFTTFSSLVGLDEVRSLIADEVARLAAAVEHHDLLISPFQQGRDITRTRSIIQRGPEDDVATSASFTEFESAVVE